MSAIATLSVKVVADIEKALSGLKDLDAKLKGSVKEMEKVGKNMTMKLTLPIVAFGGLAVKTASDFQQGMSEVQAISGATGEDLELLTNKAKEMGIKTKFSAKESAEAFKYMAMAGWKTEAMLEGLDGIMMLASASGEDLGLVSDIVTDALTAFGMSASESGTFADLLASTASNANTNVAMLGESFKYVAPIFGSVGYTAEDASLALGLMANSGIKGSQAGTALRGAISRLINPVGEAKDVMKELDISITDANGNMLPFGDMMEQLREKFKKLTPEQQAQSSAMLFGQEAMSGMLAIINATEEDYAKLSKATTDYTGKAQEMSDVMMDNLSGGLTLLKSDLEGLMIQIGDLLIPMMTDLVAWLREVVAWFAGLDDGTKMQIMQFMGFLAVLGPVIFIVAKLVGTILFLIDTFKKLKALFLIVKTAMLAITAPTWIVIAVVAGLIAVGILLWKNWDKVKEVAGIVWEWIKTKISGVGDWIVGVYNKMMEGVNLLGQKWEELKQWTQDLWTKIGEIFTGMKNAVVNTFKQLWEGIKGVFMSFVKGGLIGLVNDYILKPFFDIDLFKVGKQVIDGLWNGIKSMAGSIGNNIKNFATNSILNPFKKLFGINSPSKLFAEYGLNLSEGLEKGILSSTGIVMDASLSMGESTLKGFSMPNIERDLNNNVMSVDGLGKSGEQVIEVHFGSDIYRKIINGINDEQRYAGRTLIKI